jgi:hypothetical protein
MTPERLLGTLVHRLFQRNFEPGLTFDVYAPGLLTDQERLEVAEAEVVAQRALNVYAAMRGRPDVAAILASGTCYYEVPFSFVPRASVDGLEPAGHTGEAPQVIRGVIDCLVVPEAGPPIVVEFKTGSPRPVHESQTSMYRSAVQAVFSAEDVEIKILYAAGQ